LEGVGGAVGSFVTVGIAGYALNVANTGHVLGYLGTHIDTPLYEQPAHPSKLANGVDVLYETLDLSVLSDHAITVLWIAGVGPSVVYALWRRGLDWTALAVALPFLSPLLVLRAGDVVARLARSGGFPVRGELGNIGDLNRTVSGSAFGPVGAVVLVGVPLV